MGRIARWTTSIHSRFDHFFSQIENHDELVRAALREAGEARARARVQLARVRRDGERMGQRLRDLTALEARWTERARRIAAEDEARALECLRRKRRAEAERVALERELAEHGRIEGRLKADVGRIDERIRQLESQRNLLRTRQSRAEALAATQANEGPTMSEIDDILERWEIKITSHEGRADCDLEPFGDGEDDLEARFMADEEREVLRNELSELLGGTGEPDPGAGQATAPEAHGHD